MAFETFRISCLSVLTKLTFCLSESPAGRGLHQTMRAFRLRHFRQSLAILAENFRPGAASPLHLRQNLIYARRFYWPGLCCHSLYARHTERRTETLTAV